MIILRQTSAKIRKSLNLYHNKSNASKQSTPSTNVKHKHISNTLSNKRDLPAESSKVRATKLSTSDEISISLLGLAIIGRGPKAIRLVWMLALLVVALTAFGVFTFHVLS